MCERTSPEAGGRKGLSHKTRENAFFYESAFIPSCFFRIRGGYDE